ncbi:protein of unknown function [Pseudorhizobium banfieldiae]|uniref:Uncharacterized protein n=1 Tax=Pseudorhizobium banfieldiae TaxID=1125847 RepID=L0NL45_9HYPH|nr:protein of unknown function [Pseudorhizobium banfieldiae]
MPIDTSPQEGISQPRRTSRLKIKVRFDVVDVVKHKAFGFLLVAPLQRVEDGEMFSVAAT